MKPWKKECLGSLCLLLALAVFCSLAARVLIPKRHDYGATWEMYRAEPEHTVDVLFLGSSLVYCDVVPAVIYEETGLRACLMAGPDQRMPITYYYLREACKTQSPQAVFIEATAMVMDEATPSAKINLTYMPYNENRLLPTFSAVGREEWAGLLFPLYAYHDRWDELSAEDWREGLFGVGPDPLAGYTFLDQAAPVKAFSYGEYGGVFERNLEYAEKIVRFCGKRGIEPIFYLAPAVSRLTEPLQDQLREKLEALGAEFWNFDPELPQLGLDLSKDFFDDLHFNYRGAEKFSRRFAEKLEEKGLSPNGAPDGGLWEERVRRFSSLREEWDQKPVRERPVSREEGAP